MASSFSIIWSPKAIKMYNDTLEYWSNRNKSNLYSKKIMREVQLAEVEISEDPYFLTNFFEDIKLYRKRVFNSKFYLFFEIDNDEKTIYIQYFRSAYQKPLSEFI